MAASMALRGPTTAIAHRAWNSQGTGALFTHRIRKLSVQGLASASRALQASPSKLRPPNSVASQQFRAISHRHNAQRPTTARISHQSSYPTLLQRRVLQTSSLGKEEHRAQTAKAQGAKGGSYRDEIKSTKPTKDVEEDESQTFKKTDRAAQASQVNLSAKLSSHGQDGEGKSSGGLREVARLLRIARPEVPTLSWAFLCLFISSGVTASIPLTVGKVLDSASHEVATIFGYNIETFLVVYGALLATGAFANYGRVIILRIVGERIVTKLRSTLFKRTFVQNAEFFDANRVGDLISRLGSDTIIVGKSITQNLSDGLRALVSASVGLSMMAWVSVKLTAVLFFAFPPIGVAAFLYGRAVRTLSRQIQKNLGSLTKVAEERLGNVRTSQAFAGEQQEVQRYNTQVRKIFHLGKKEAKVTALFFGGTGFMGNATVMAILYIGSGMVRSGEISIGDLSTFCLYAGFAGSSVFGLSSFYSELMKGVGAASRLFELQDREPTISPTKGDMVKSARGAIEFKDVGFAYPTRPAVPIFNDLTFTIPQGSNVAIVAPSGAGKSTVATLLMRFYVPTKGQISIAGKDIETMNAKQLRRKIGYVGQEPVLFSGTIAENIAYGKPLASRQEIVAAARQANCQFISDFVSNPYLGILRNSSY